MAASQPRPIPARQGRSEPGAYTEMPQAPPQPYYPPPPNHPQVSDIRSDAGVSPNPQQYPRPGPLAPSPHSYGAPAPQPYQPYGTTPPQQSYGTTPPRGNMVPPPQAYGTTPPQQYYGTTPPQQAYGSTPPLQGDPNMMPPGSFFASNPSYAPQQPYPAQPPGQQPYLHPADAYAAGGPEGYPPPGRPRRGTGSSVASADSYGRRSGSRGYSPRRAHQQDRRRRLSYDPSYLPPHAYEFHDERRRRASEDPDYERKRERRRRQAHTDDLERRPTVGDSTVWAWNKLKGAFGGPKD